MKVISVTLTKCTNPNDPRVLYHYARSCWRIAPAKIQRITHVLAIHNGVVKEVYKVARWNQISSSPAIEKKDRGRWAFDGSAESNVAIRQKYIGMEMDTSRNPVRYR